MYLLVGALGSLEKGKEYQRAEWSGLGSSHGMPPERPRPCTFFLDRREDLYYSVGVMKKPDSLGQFEQVVLTAILTLGDDAYGVTIHKKVGELTHPKPVSLGAIYITLDRLEDKKLVASWLTDPTPERGGRSKRCYRLEALGERALQESAATARRIWESIAEVWGKDQARAWGKRLGKQTS